MGNGTGADHAPVPATTPRMRSPWFFALLGLLLVAGALLYSLGPQELWLPLLISIPICLVIVWIGLRVQRNNDPGRMLRWIPWLMTIYALTVTARIILHVVKMWNEQPGTVAESRGQVQQQGDTGISSDPTQMVCKHLSDLILLKQAHVLVADHMRGKDLSIADKREMLAILGASRMRRMTKQTTPPALAKPVRWANIRLPGVIDDSAQFLIYWEGGGFVSLGISDGDLNGMYEITSGRQQLSDWIGKMVGIKKQFRFGEDSLATPARPAQEPPK